MNPLVGQFGSGPEPGSTASPRTAAIAPARRVLHPVEGGGRDGERMRLGVADLDDLSESAAESAGPAGVGQKLLPPEDEGTLGFRNFHGNCTDPARKGGDGEPILSGARSDPSHPDIHDVEPVGFVCGSRSGIGIATGEGKHPDAPGALRRDFPRERLRQAAEGHVRQHLANDVARRNRARMQRMHRRSRLGNGPEYAQRSVVVRNPRGDDALHAETGIRLGVAEGRVDAVGGCPRRALVVDNDLRIRDPHLGADENGLAVAVEFHIRTVPAIGHPAHRFPHRLFRGREDVVGEALDALQTELRHHRAEAFRAGVVATHERKDIAPDLDRVSGIGEHDR